MQETILPLLGQKVILFSHFSIGGLPWNFFPCAITEKRSKNTDLGESICLWTTHFMYFPVRPLEGAFPPQMRASAILKPQEGEKRRTGTGSPSTGRQRDSRHVTTAAVLKHNSSAAVEHVSCRLSSRATGSDPSRRGFIQNKKAV